MIDKLIIEQDETLVRDTKSNAILNTDMTALEKYRAGRKRQMEIAEKIDEIDTLKEEISEIKIMLYELLNQRK